MRVCSIELVIVLTKKKKKKKKQKKRKEAQERPCFERPAVPRKSATKETRSRTRFFFFACQENAFLGGSHRTN